MGNWEEVKLKDVIKVVNGRAYKKPELLSKGKYRVLRVGNLFTNNSWYWSDLELNEDKYCDDGDLIYAWSASFGPRIWQEEKVIYHYHIWKMICDEKKIDKDFAFHFLDWDKDMMKKEHSRGVGMFHLTKTAIENRKLLLPPLPKQKRIVAKLDGLFEKIDAAIKLLEENIAHTQALMGSVLDGIYSDGDVMIKDLCIVGPKKSEVKDLDDTLEVSFLPMRDLNEHEINFKPNEIKNLKEVYKGYTYFADGDIILAKVTPCFENGKAGLAKGLLNGIGFGSSEYHVLRPNENVLPEWVYFAVLTEQFRVTGKENMTGAGGLKRVPRPFLEEWKIPVPKLSIQKKQINRIVQIQEETKKLNDSITQNLEDLKQLKSSLLDQAFKGEL
ncbi:restriction endonuclease subunit S [Nonlabens sp. YIK11]|uniref:restriction endonuclease subunit S n=1 Tax=Nonlabens sp. YIK11 TaxID=1453349 RepID=UPI0006DC4FDE|nr:restriction endonuclease subunit S [Nonlabens sp. YIK11]